MMAASLAHPEPHAPLLADWLGTWTLDPLVLLTLLVVGGAYVRGAVRLRSRTAPGKGLRGWQLACMAGGWLSIIVSLISPLDALSDLSFAAHMTQHEILMLVAAPLLVLGRPLPVLLWALPEAPRQRVGQLIRRPWFAATWRRVTGPFTTLLLHGAVVWIWHVPVLFDAALAHEAVHAVQHLAFFVTAALFWWALIHGRYGRVGYGVSVLFVFATALHESVLGALLTLARVAWYPLAARRAEQAGLDAVEDQQLAGLLMWVPSGLLLALVGLALFGAWLGHIERRTRRASS